jgi:hypothetical protein
MFYYHCFATCLKDHHVHDPQVVRLYHHLHHCLSLLFDNSNVGWVCEKSCPLSHVYVACCIKPLDEVFANQVEIQLLMFIWWWRHDFFCDSTTPYIH